jgi:hypothetical protein
MQLKLLPATETLDFINDLPLMLRDTRRFQLQGQDWN